MHDRGTSSGIASRIVNGEEAVIESFPWQVAIRETFRQKIIICGGSIFNENWIITAAHCTDQFDNGREVTITAGHTESDFQTARKQPLYQLRNVITIIEHLGWRRRAVKRDFAMLQVETPLVFNDAIFPICLPPPDFNIAQNFPAEKEKEAPVCVVSGWGDTRGTGDGKLLSQASLPLHSNRNCNKMLGSGSLPDNFNLCAGYFTKPIDSCEGDSGGPLACFVDNSWTLVGVVSWGYSCAEPHSPGVYSRVSQFRPWIDRVVQYCTDDSQTLDCRKLAFDQKPKTFS